MKNLWRCWKCSENQEIKDWLYAGSCTIFCKIGGGFQKEYPDIKLVLMKESQVIYSGNWSLWFLDLERKYDGRSEKFRFPHHDDKLCSVIWKHPLYGRDQLKELKMMFLSSREAAVTKCFIRVVRKQIENRNSFEFPQIQSWVCKWRVGVTITFSTVYREAKCAGVKMIPLEDELHSMIPIFIEKCHWL